VDLPLQTGGGIDAEDLAERAARILCVAAEITDAAAVVAQVNIELAVIGGAGCAVV